MSQWLPYLLLLACPVSMGLMMWLMLRMDHRNQPAHDPRVAELESQMAELRSELMRRPVDGQEQPGIKTEASTGQS